MYIIQDEKSNGMMQLLMSSEALNFGYSVFETIKVRQGDIRHLDRHMERLYSSCETIGITAPPLSELESKLFEFVRDKEGTFALKLLIGKMYDMPLVCISTREISYSDEDYKKGMKLCIAKTIRDSNNTLNGIKSANYMGNFLAKKQALEMGFNEPVFLNEKGDFTEGATTNIFFKINDEIVTPKLEDGILPGVMRAYILSRNPQIIQRSVSYAELKDIQGAVLTNSLLEVIGVSCIDERQLPLGEINLL